MNKAGEDALFISPNKMCLAVFDGVGGWAKQGVDASAYSNSLANGCKVAHAKGIFHPTDMMQHAYEASLKVQGTSTACVCVIQQTPLSLVVSNLGDSKVIVVRDLKVCFASQEQQIVWNTPYQMGSGSDMQPKSHAVTTTIPLRANDWIVLATDGLFDNLSYPEIVNVLRKGGNCTALSVELSEQAFKVSTNTKANTPFAKEAKKAGKPWQGGKTDDISVIVAQIIP